MILGNRQLFLGSGQLGPWILDVGRPRGTANVRILGPRGYPKSLQLVDPMVVLKLGQLVHIPQATRHKVQ